MEEKKRVKRKRLTSAQKDKQVEVERRRALIKACLQKGECTTKVEISKATGIKLSTVTSDISADKELFAEYKLNARTIAEIAADNISEIIKDKKHPKNYAASMKMIETYESEFNEVLDTNDSGFDMDIDIENSGGGATISFGVKK